MLLARVAVDPAACSRELRQHLDGNRSFTWQGYRVVYRVFEELNAVAVVGVGVRSAQCRKPETLARTGKLAEGVLFSLRGFSKPTS
jgi:hypothetical protein